MKMHIRKGDTVEVISGIHAGERGKVLKVFPQQGRALVEGVNFIKRHTRASPKNQQGGIIEKEAPVASSKLMLVDPQSEQRTRVRRKRLADGTRIRIAAKSGEQIPDAS